MKRISQYIKNLDESFQQELDDISGWLGSLENLSDVLDRIENSKILGGSGNDRFGGRNEDGMDEHTKRYIGIILKRLLSDPEIIAWYDSPYNNEVELSALLAKKLSHREMNYLGEISELLADMEDSDKDAEIVNNAIVRLLDDDDLEKWFKKNSKPIKTTNRYGDVEFSDRKINEFELRKLINSKLSGPEKRFSEPIARKFLRIYYGEYDSDDYFSARNDDMSSHPSRSNFGRRR